MSTEIFIAVLGAALLHASWNALVKFGADRLVAISVMAFFPVSSHFSVFSLLVYPHLARSLGYSCQSLFTPAIASFSVKPTSKQSLGKFIRLPAVWHHY